MSTIVNGTDILLKLDGDIIACAKSHTITITTEVRDLASKCTAGWKESAKGRFAWSGSVDGLVDFTVTAGQAKYKDLFAALTAGTLVEIISTGAGTGAFVLTGDALITSLDLSAGDAENATFTCSFEGSSPLVLTIL